VINQRLTFTHDLDLPFQFTAAESRQRFRNSALPAANDKWCPLTAVRKVPQGGVHACVLTGSSDGLSVNVSIAWTVGVRLTYTYSNRQSCYRRSTAVPILWWVCHDVCVRGGMWEGVSVWACTLVRMTWRLTQW